MPPFDVKPGELTEPGLVCGVDHLLLGNVINVRVKRDATSNGFGVAQLGGVVNLGGLDVKDNQTVVTTECGVDIRLSTRRPGR